MSLGLIILPSFQLIAIVARGFLKSLFVAIVFEQLENIR